MKEHIVIIGNGIAGITAARHIRKLSDKKITVISGEGKYFFSRTALMYIYMGDMQLKHTQPYPKDFWQKNNIDLVFDWVTNIDPSKKSVLLKKQTSIKYDKLIIASGSTPNKFGWPGQDLKGVQGLYSLQDLETMEENTQNISRATIVGGGLIGIEMAEMLHSRNIPVDFLVRESGFWRNVLPITESDIIMNHIKENGINLLLNTSLKTINGKDSVSSITTEDGKEITSQFVGLAVGVHPTIAWLTHSTIACKKGVLVNEFLETNIPNIYAIGDCAEFTQHPTGRRNIEQVWYTGRMMGETVALTICKEKTAYAPGIWFNSAKFFSLEYQTYGDVSPQSKDNEDSLYWTNSENTKCLHIVYDKTTFKLIGINTIGIRLRHEVCERWIHHKRTLPDILPEFHDANFDPEFSEKYEKELLHSFNNKHHTKLTSKKKSWKRILGLT